MILQCCGSGSGIRCLFWPPGSGIRDGKKIKIRIWDEHPGSYLRKFRNNFYNTKILWCGFGIRENSDPGSRDKHPRSATPDPLKFNVWFFASCCAARPTKRSLSASRSRFGTASPGACPVPRLLCSGSSSSGWAESPICSAFSNPRPHETGTDLRFQALTSLSMYKQKNKILV